MPKERFTEQFVVTVVSDKPITDLVDIVAGRLWSLDHVTEATATKLQVNPPAEQPGNEPSIGKPDFSALMNDFRITLTDAQFTDALKAFEADPIKVEIVHPKVEVSMTGFLQTTDSNALIKEINDNLRRANKLGVL